MQRKRVEWQRLWSWFKSLTWFAERRSKLGRRHGKRAPHRRPLRRGLFPFEVMEARQMLAGDISLTEFGATGTHFVVSYEITIESPVLPPGDLRGEIPPFTVSVYRSSDGVSLHGLVGTRNVTLDEERTPGKHTIGIGAEFSDVRGDYRLIAVADRFNKVAELSEENNRAAFGGGAVLAADGTLHVHASDAADVVTINVAGDRLRLKVNHWTMDYAADAVREVHARLHGGDDIFKTLGPVSQNIHVFGGAGDDRLSTSHGSDSVFGGEGNDILFAGSGSDLLVGDDGDDILHGGAGPDSLYGMGGNDRHFGGGGKDTLDGGEGDDVLHAGSSEDKSRGGLGRDRFVEPDANELEDQEPDDSVSATLTRDELAAESLVFGDVSSGENSISAMSTASGGYGYSYGTVWLDYGGPSLPEENSNNVHTFTILREYWRTYTEFRVDFTLSGTATYWDEYWLPGTTVFNGSTIWGYEYFSIGQETIPLYVSVVDDYWEEYDESITITLLDQPGYEVAEPSTNTAYILDDEYPWGDLDIIEGGVELSESAEDFPGGKLLAGGPAAEIRVSDLSLPLDHYALTRDSRFTVSQSPDGSNPIQNWGEVTEGVYYVRSTVPGEGWVNLHYDSWPNGLYGGLDSVQFVVRLPRFSVELRDAVSLLYLPEDNTVNEHVFTVRRNPEDVGVAKTVSYTVSGTATSGPDYNALSGSVSFGPNDLTKEIRVTVVNDTIYEGNETLTVTLSSSTQYDVTGGPATANIFETDLDIIGALDVVVEEHKEETPGGFVGVNIDDDDGDGVFDGEDPIVEGGDDDLQPLLLRAASPGLAGSYFTLHFSDAKLRLWKNANRTELITSGVTTLDAQIDQYVYVEGHGIPNGPSIVPVELRWHSPQSSATGSDFVKVSVLKLEIVTRDEVTGEVYQPDIIYPSDPIPEVSLQVVSTVINDYGQLVVTVEGSVSDRLSELADNPLNRVQKLDFLVNHQPAGTIDNLVSLATGSGVLPWRPYTFEHSFQRTFVFDRPGHTYVIRAQTSANAAGSTGWDQVTVVGGYERVATPLPELFSLTDPLTIRFSAQPSQSVIDTGFVYFGNRDQSPGDGTITETDLGGLDFSGDLHWPVIVDPAKVRIQLDPTETFSSVVIDQFEAVIGLDMPDGRRTAFRATFQESSPNSLRFVQVGAFDPETPAQEEGIGGWWYNEPIVEYVDHSEGSARGNFEPFLVRVDGLDETTEPATTTDFDGETHDLEPFTYSPKRFYVADRPAQGERPRIYVVTAKTLPTDMQHIQAGDINIGRDGGGLFATLRSDNSRTRLNVQVTVIGDDPEVTGTAGEPPGGPVTEAQMLLWYDFLYGEKGALLLQHFQAMPGNYITLGDVAGDLDIDGWGDNDLEIEIEEDISPIEAAQLLWIGLERASAYYWARIPDDHKFHLNQQARAQVAAEVGAAVAPFVESYLAGIGIVSEGADWVMTVNEIAEGNVQASVGFIPFIPSSAFRAAGNVVVKNAAGDVVMRLSKNAVDAFKIAAGKATLADRWNAISHLPLSSKARQFLVDKRFLKPPSRPGGLRENLGTAPATFKNPQAHHDMPWFLRKRFAQYGLDVNLAQYGRWVEGTPPGRHQNWSAAFNREWSIFFGAENAATPYTQQQVLDRWNLLRSDPRFR